MKRKQRPLFDRVIVQRLEDEMPESRVYVREARREKPMRASVIAVGPGQWDHSTFVTPTVRVGDEVLIGKYAGTIYEEVGDDFKTREYVILRESDILSVFVKEKK